MCMLCHDWVSDDGNDRLSPLTCIQRRGFSHTVKPRPGLCCSYEQACTPPCPNLDIQQQSSAEHCRVGRADPARLHGKESLQDPRPGPSLTYSNDGPSTNVTDRAWPPPIDPVHVKNYYGVVGPSVAASPFA